MSDQITVVEVPQITVIFPVADGTENTFPFRDAFPDRDAATISDADLIAGAIRWCDKNPGDYPELVATRPVTGNIIISRKATFGDRNVRR